MLANSFFCENLQFGASLHHLSEIFIDDNMMCISLFSYGSPVVVRCMRLAGGCPLPGACCPLPGPAVWPRLTT